LRKPPRNGEKGAAYYPRPLLPSSGHRGPGVTAIRVASPDRNQAIAQRLASTTPQRKTIFTSFGFFAGAGFGYHTSEDSYSDGYNNYTDKMSGFGPVGNAGIRIGVGSGSHNIEIRLSYMKTLDTSKSSIFGIGGLFNF